MFTVRNAIADAEEILESPSGSDWGEDPHWQAVIRVAEFVESDPEPLWQFALKWGSSAEEDTRAAVASCLLEHLLEHHFALIFPRVAEAGRLNALFRDTFTRCWKFGQSELPDNACQFDALKAEFEARLDG